MQPTRGDVHVNRPLTNMSVAYMQSASKFIADKVFPIVSVDKQSDRYWTYDRGDMNRDEMELRAPGTESAGRGYSVDSTPTYYAPVYAYHHDVPDQVRSNADTPLNPDRDGTYIATLKALIKREILWAAQYFTDGVWATDYFGGPSNDTDQVLYWSDASSTPIEDVEEAATLMGLTGFRPNTLVLGRPVFSALKNHPDIVDRIKYTSGNNNPAIVNQQALAALFDVERVLIMDAVYNSAKKGLTTVDAYIGGKNALLCYTPPQAGIMIPSAGYTFAWNGYLGASALGTRISQFRMEHLKSDRIEIEMAIDQKMVASDLGIFWRNIVL